MSERLPEELERVAALVGRAAPRVGPPPAALRAQTLEAIEREAAPRRETPAAPRRKRRLPRLAPVFGAVAAVACAVALVLLVGGNDQELELQARLGGPGASADADVTETGIGRVIEFRSDDLRILPKGEFYELWFVGPGDRPGRPNRISAGTFHPDPQGRSNVTFAAAVDPAKYPRLVVTAEPGDGDPRPSSREVLSSER